jgi:MFS family permease
MVGRLLASMGVLMQDVAVGWQLYDRTHSAFALGLTGLASVAPTILFALPAGAVADRYDRRNVVRLARILAGLMSVALAILSTTHGPVWLIYVALFLGGIGFAFLAPAQSALLAQVLPIEAYPNGVTWNSTGFQIAAVTGPALGGALIAITGTSTTVYVVCALMAIAYLVSITLIRPRPQVHNREPITPSVLAAGVRFVFNDQLILAAITLDLFAVLFGGATTLLPIYAKDILQVGPTGLGWLRAAPSVGAMLTALWLAHRSRMYRAGLILLGAVIGFGIATIIFGLSKSFTLSMVALFMLGAFDSVSVVIRSSLVQLRTPDAMRGRVNAVNGIFIDLSNELGGFESGSVAALIGPIPTVVLGGIGTILVVFIVGAKWRALREMRELEEQRVE